MNVVAFASDQFVATSQALAGLLLQRDFPGIAGNSPVITRLVYAHHLRPADVVQLRMDLKALQARGGPCAPLDRYVRRLPGSLQGAASYVRHPNLIKISDAPTYAATRGARKFIPTHPLDRYEGNIPLQARVLWREKYRVHFTEALQAARAIHTVEDLIHAIDRFANAMGHMNNDYYDAFIAYMKDIADAGKKNQVAIYEAMIEGPAAAIKNEIISLFRASVYLNQLPEEYNTWRRNLENEQRLYHPDNAADLNALTALGRQYNKAFGTIKIEYGGKTLDYYAILGKLGSNLPRAEREQIAGALQEKLDAIREEADEIYHQMVGRRHAIAIRSGGFRKFANYGEYGHASWKYSFERKHMADALQAMKARIRPLTERTLRDHARGLGLGGMNELMPCDMAGRYFLAKPERSRPILPYKGLSEAQILEKAQKAFEAMHPELGQVYARIVEAKNVDLMTRPGKNPNMVFCVSFYRVDGMPEDKGIPYLSISIDPETATGTMIPKMLMHESSHAVQGLANMDAAPTPGVSLVTAIEAKDIAETTSLTAEEVVVAGHLDAFLSDADQILATQREFRVGSLLELAINATFVEFEDWVYANPEVGKQERDDKFYELALEYGVVLPHWHRRYAANIRIAFQHFFNFPYYSCAYFFARIVAMQVGFEYRRILTTRGKEAAQEYLGAHYVVAVKKGAALTLPQYWETLGVPFDFGDEKIDAFFAKIGAELSDYGIAE